MPNHMFTNATIGNISGGTFITHAHSEKSALDRLSTAAAHSALHDAPARTDETRCLQHTRTNVLDHLERWAQGICDEGASIFWLHGGAGAGKSAVMQTLAERCFAQELALGSFFFSRSDPTRNTAEVLIPTLVYQLAHLFPSTLQVLKPIIDPNPLIFNKSLQVQLVDLLVVALQQLVQRGLISNAPQSPRVFLIDGLDECSDASQQQAIIQAVTAVCHKHRIPVKFLIASRLEHQISTSFGLFEDRNCVLGSMSLSDDPDAEDDIRRFIEAEFLKICLQHPFRKMIPSHWPDYTDIHMLVRKSSSHFIYASTAMTYIWSLKENPVRSLQVVLGLEVSRTISTFAGIDSLYNHILGSAAYCDKVLQILALCVYTDLPPLANVACIVLNFSQDDLLVYIADIAPLVALYQSASLPNEREVKLLHASLGDYLRDPSRSGSLYVKENAFLASSLERCFRLLDLYSREQRTSPVWPASAENIHSSPYIALVRHILDTIGKSGHYLETQGILRRYSFRYFHQCQMRFACLDPESIGFDYRSSFELLVATRSIETSDSFHGLFTSFLEELFDILESYINEECTSFPPAILSLIFVGSSIKRMRWMLQDWISSGLRGGQFFEYAMNFLRKSDIVTDDDLTAIRHYGIYSSPQSVAVAAEAILESLYHPNLDYSDGVVFAHLDALLDLLPTAGFSERIILYSDRTFPRGVSQCEPNHCCRVQESLDNYNNRVRTAKLAELDRSIEMGDVTALMEKSAMLNLNAQD